MTIEKNKKREPSKMVTQVAGLLTATTKEINGIRFLNTTKHYIKLRSADGVDHVVEPSGFVVNAGISEFSHEPPLHYNRIEASFVEPEFLEEEEVHQCIQMYLDVENIGGRGHRPPVVMLGSIVAAQAYPGLICAMIPYPGFERVPPAEKRMRIDKFTIYGI